MTKYPVAVWNTNGVYTAKVPDLPGVVTEADSIGALQNSVKEAVVGWMEAECDGGRPIPKPGGAESYTSDPDYRDCFWTQVDIDRATLFDKIGRGHYDRPGKSSIRQAYGQGFDECKF